MDSRCPNCPCSYLVDIARVACLVIVERLEGELVFDGKELEGFEFEVQALDGGESAVAQVHLHHPKIIEGGLPNHGILEDGLGAFEDAVELERMAQN